jgi:hypothetical protein
MNEDGDSDYAAPVAICAPFVAALGGRDEGAQEGAMRRFDAPPGFHDP